MRYKSCRKLGEVICKSVNEIMLGRGGTVDGNTLLVMSGPSCSMARLAKLNGFKDEVEMFNWFTKTYWLPFRGLLIRW
jgi:hypothetical protein